MRLAHGILHDSVAVHSYSLLSTVTVANYDMIFQDLHFHDFMLKFRQSCC